MLRRLIRWRAKFRYWAVALFGPFVIMLTGIGIYILTGGEPPPLTFWKEEWYLAPVLMLGRSPQKLYHLGLCLL